VFEQEPYAGALGVAQGEMMGVNKHNGFLASRWTQRAEFLSGLKRAPMPKGTGTMGPLNIAGLPQVTQGKKVLITGHNGFPRGSWMTSLLVSGSGLT